MITFAWHIIVKTLWLKTHNISQNIYKNVQNYSLYWVDIVDIDQNV